MLTIHADPQTERELIKLLNSVKLQSATLSLVIVEHTLNAGPSAGLTAELPATEPSKTIKAHILDVLQQAGRPMKTSEVVSAIQAARGPFALARSTTIYNALRLAKLRGDVTHDTKAGTWSFRERKSK